MNKDTEFSLFEDEEFVDVSIENTMEINMEQLGEDNTLDVNHAALQTSNDLKTLIESEDFDFELDTLDGNFSVNDIEIDGENISTLQSDVDALIGEIDNEPTEIETTITSIIEEPQVVVANVVEPVVAEEVVEPLVSVEPVIAAEEPFEPVINVEVNSFNEEIENFTAPLVPDMSINAVDTQLDITKDDIVMGNIDKEEFNNLVGDINIVSNDIVKEISVKEEEIKEDIEMPFGKVNIMVLGVGDNGCTTINTLYELNNKEVTTVSMHVSSQMLSSRLADKKILVGESIFNGDGSNGVIEDVTSAFEDDEKKIRHVLQGVDMLFLTGDFGTDIGSIGLVEVAKVAKELGILTIGFPKVLRRNTDIDTGDFIDTYLPAFKEVVDSTVIIDDNVLFPKIAKLNLFEAVMYSDNMLISGIRGIYELITRAGKINLDYADIKTAFSDRGDAILGCGTASGEHLVVRAIEDAFKSEVLDLASVKNAQTIIFNISCAQKTVTIDNATEATNYIYSLASNGTVQQLFFGYTLDESLGDEVRVTFVAAGTSPTIPGQNITPNNNNSNEPFAFVSTLEEKATEVTTEKKEESEAVKSKPRFFDF